MYKKEINKQKKKEIKNIFGICICPAHSALLNFSQRSPSLSFNSKDCVSNCKVCLTPPPEKKKEEWEQTLRAYFEQYCNWGCDDSNKEKEAVKFIRNLLSLQRKELIKTTKWILRDLQGIIKQDAMGLATDIELRELEQDIIKIIENS